MAGDIDGRQARLTHQKALILQTTIFNTQAYDAGLREAMRMAIDEFTLTYPGIKHVEHEYFYAVRGADGATGQGYLERAYALEVATSEPVRATRLPEVERDLCARG